MKNLAVILTAALTAIFGLVGVLINTTVTMALSAKDQPFKQAAEERERARAVREQAAEDRERAKADRAAEEDAAKRRHDPAQVSFSLSRSSASGSYFISSGAEARIENRSSKIIDSHQLVIGYEGESIHGEHLVGTVSVSSSDKIEGCTAMTFPLPRNEDLINSFPDAARIRLTSVNATLAFFLDHRFWERTDFPFTIRGETDGDFPSRAVKDAVDVGSPRETRTSRLRGCQPASLG